MNATPQRFNVTSRLSFISHAATEAQLNIAFPLDEPIIERERTRFTALGRKISRAERIWSAPERRTQQTSQVLGLRATVTHELRDCDYGRWHGRTMEDVQASHAEGFLAWLTDPASAPHEGESIERLIGRVGLWMDQQIHFSNTLAVTHPAVIRAAIVYALRLPPQVFWRLDMAPLTLTDLRFSRNQWTLRSMGCDLNAMRRSEEIKEGC